MRTIAAREVMNDRVLSVPESMSVHELATFLVDHEISGAPVEDASGTLVGVVSTTDLARAASEGGNESEANRLHFYHGWEAVDGVDRDDLAELHIESEGLSVRDIMTPTVFAVEADSPISHVAQSMLDAHLHRLLVVDDRKVIGIISTSDLLRLLAGPDDPAGGGRAD